MGLVLVPGDTISTPPKIPTGIFQLDVMLGKGSNGLAGIPIGRYSLIYGPEGSMKTTLVLKILGNAQKMCFSCFKWKKECICSNPRDPEIVFIDQEQAWTKEWAIVHGCDPSKIKIGRPDNIDDFINGMLELIKANDIIVIETLAKICRDDESDTIDDDRGAFGEIARKLSDADNRWLAEIEKKRRETGRYTTIIIENQVRVKMTQSNVPAAYLPDDMKENLPGGKWQGYDSSCTIRLESAFKAEKDSDDLVESMVYKFKIKKNKVFLSRGYEGKFTMAMANTGNIRIGDIIDTEEFIIDVGMDLGLFEQLPGKNTIVYKGANHLGEVVREEVSKPHKKGMINYLRENPELTRQIMEDISNWLESRHSTFVEEDASN